MEIFILITVGLPLLISGAAIAISVLAIRRLKKPPQYSWRLKGK